MTRALGFALAAWLVAAPAARADYEDPLDGAAGRRELGARVGLQLASGVAPGGLRVAGAYLHRMTTRTYFDGEAAFSYGGGDRGCYLARDGGLTCEPGNAQGFSAQLHAGGRWFPRTGSVMPYLRAGGAVHISTFGADDVWGVAVPLWAGAGARLRVSDRIAVGGDVTITAGGALYNRGLGLQPYAQLIVQLGIDFDP